MAPGTGAPYVVEMVGVTVDPEVAVQRGIVRHITEGRGVPEAAAGRRWGEGRIGLYPSPPWHSPSSQCPLSLGVS